MQGCFEEVRTHLSVSASRQKNYYDKRSKPRSFKQGDWVLRFYPPGLSRSKLNPQYIGPYLVVKQLGEVTYQIQEGPQKQPVAIHVDHLKRYESDNPPDSWLSFETRLDIPDSPENPSESSVPKGNYDSFSGDQNETSGMEPQSCLSRRRVLPARFKDFVL